MAAETAGWEKCIASLVSVRLSFFRFILIVQTGDYQTSLTLPAIDSVAVLLLNAWVLFFDKKAKVCGIFGTVS